MKKKRKWKDKLFFTAVSAAVSVLLAGIFYTAGVSALSQGEVKDAVLARSNIEQGVKITKDNVKELFYVRQVNKELIPEHAPEDIQRLVGYTTVSSIQEREIIVRDDFYKTENQKNLMEEPTELALKASSAADCAGGHIRGGNRINIGTVKLTEYGTTEYQCVAENVYVKEAFDENGKAAEDSDREAVCTMFSVIMERREAEYMIEQLRDGEETIITLPYHQGEFK